MSKAQLSIITPSLRQLDWLRLCAASVADQAGVEVEHIVQDAGSGPELETWAQSQSGLRLFVESDAGMYDAINRGLARASGEICAWLNCDEQYLPGALAKVRAFFETHPAVDVLFADGIVVDENGAPLAYRRVIAPTPLHTRLMFSGTLTCSMFFRRAAWERVKFDPQWRDNGDAVWVHDVLRAGLRVAVLNEPHAVFTLTGQNMSTGENPRREYERWNRLPDAPPRWLRAPVRAWFWLRKWCAGAYRSRDVEVSLFTKVSPAARQTFSVKNLTHRWPGGGRG